MSLSAPTSSAYTDVSVLARHAAAQLNELIAIAQTTGGVHGDHHARVVLTGGTAGIATLKAMREIFDEQQAGGGASHQLIDYSRVHFFFGDERNVAVDHPDSNEGQARQAWLDHVPVPEANIHSFQLGTLSLEDSVSAMQEKIANFAPQGFDVHLLGMGGEGHINSLFPHTAALAEQDQLVVAVTDSPKPPAERATLTLPAVNRSAKVWFLIAGAGKEEALSAVLDRGDAAQWPAAGAAGLQSTHVFATEDAFDATYRPAVIID
ncbi:6-phosphogluconolactonase [Corynebacterium aquilae]|uniref:6-phosphogluconolactonase n=1 Tax=Corynebacterium aquilae TaxID=203263 RepID=UPI000AE0213A|nr:6-phosphogluconolactonase [Corynebacterium aquilae]